MYVYGSRHIALNALSMSNTTFLFGAILFLIFDAFLSTTTTLQAWLNLPH